MRKKTVEIKEKNVNSDGWKNRRSYTQFEGKEKIEFLSTEIPCGIHSKMWISSAFR